MDKKILISRIVRAKVKAKIILYLTLIIALTENLLGYNEFEWGFSFVSILLLLATITVSIDVYLEYKHTKAEFDSKPS